MKAQSIEESEFRCALEAQGTYRFAGAPHRQLSIFFPASSGLNLADLRYISTFSLSVTMSMNGGADVNRLFIGAGCNRIVNNVSWGACDLVAFGAQNAVAIFCPKVLPKLSPCLIELTPLAHYIHISSPPLPFWQTAQILTTLPGHKAAVNCTQWLPNNKFAFKGK